MIAQATGAPPPADFGSPPSGQIPILFNDHHVYARPDVLRQGRVLAALVRGGTILVPLRSMFEQMGATVSYNPSTRTAIVTKPGADVRVTVGRPEVTINGETRPLDVPPIMYQGNVLVPVRVISEGMGAYVQWVPDKKVVVVRYMPATPAPPPPATPVPTAAPTAAPPPVVPYLDKFIVGDYIISPKIYNEFSPGNTGQSSYAVRGGIEFSLFNLPWMLGMARVTRHAACGALAARVLAGAATSPRLAVWAERTGLERAWFELHAAGDVAHRAVVTERLLPAVADAPSEVVFGARALALLECRLAARAVGAWQADRSVLLRRPAPAVAA